MKFCTLCGAKLNDGVKFCTQCGNPIKESASTQTAWDSTYYGTSTYATPQTPKKMSGGKVALLVVCVVLALAIAAGLLLFFLSGGLNRDDDILGLYEGVSYRYGGMDMSVKDDSIELKPFGLAKLVLAGDTYFASWSLDDEDFTLKQGAIPRP